MWIGLGVCSGFDSLLSICRYVYLETLDSCKVFLRVSQAYAALQRKSSTNITSYEGKFKLQQTLIAYCRYNH